MVGTALRDSGFMIRRAPALAVALVMLCSSARADTAAFFEPRALEANGYELRVTAGYFAAARDDFARPIFLIAQPLTSLSAHQVLLQADLRLRITPALALQCVLPFMVRELDGRSYGLQVSRTQQLASQSFSLTSSGLADPLLAASYRFVRSPPWAAYGELGATFPIDDDPGSPVFPSRVPLGTGQHVLFAGLGASLREPLRLSLGYRFGFSPGEHAAFLVRRAGPQSYTSGAVTSTVLQRVQAAAEVTPWRALSLQLMAAWTLRSLPDLVEYAGASTRFLGENWAQEVSLGVAVRVQIAPGHRLELRGELPIMSMVDVDPYFPMVMPAQGVGITWLVGS
jgi:hypothetical protein